MAWDAPSLGLFSTEVSSIYTGTNSLYSHKKTFPHNPNTLPSYYLSPSFPIFLPPPLGPHATVRRCKS